MIWVEITMKGNSNNFLMSCIYRPPNANVKYFDSLLDSIEKAQCENDEMIILGDLNINYELNEHMCNNPIFLIEQMFCLSQLISEPTRVTNTSSTLIDVILTSCPSKHINSGVHKSTLSDHYMIFTELVIETIRRPHNEIRYRNFNRFDSERFLSDCKILHDNLSKINDSNVYTFKTMAAKLDFLWEEWKTKFVHLSNLHAPFKISRLKHRRNKWITPEIVKQIYKRDYLHKKAIKSNDIQRKNNIWAQYRKQRNLVIHLIKKAKLHHYSSITETHKYNPKKFWKELKTVIPPTKSEVSCDISADEFNNFFSNIGNTVAAALPSTQKYNCNLQDSIHEFKFIKVNPAFVKKLISKMSKDSKNDIFDIDTKLLNISSHIISPFISLLLNLSLQSGHCPDDWKLAMVTPAYKQKGEKNEKNNYRPLSVIGHIAMITEKCVQKQLMQYLMSHKFITIDQFAYLSKHSTQTCLHRLVDDILENTNEKEITGLCFLDIKKCFDTINHDILLLKLQKYGIRNTELQWFRSYLKNRKQQVICNSKRSSKQILNIGVPQGTVLGPILFLLFVNDLSNTITNANINIYADDVVVYSSHKSKQILQQQMQGVMDKVYKWYVDNRLTLSLDKCNTMLINDNKNTSDHEFSIYLGTTHLKQISSIKYLGLIIDDKLKWTEHTMSIIKKVNINNAKLRRVAKTLPLELKQKIHNSFSVPTIDYSSTVWGSFSKKNISLIDRVEHMAARAITRNFDFINTRGSALMEELNLPTFKQRLHYNTSVLMYKAVSNQVPDYIANKVTLSKEVNNYNLRSSTNNNLTIPFPNCVIFKNALAYNGPMIWNNLPNQLTKSQSLNAFKDNYKSLLLTFKDP
jgi:hypothetical protein